jgi:hypothetical protein
MGIPEVILVLLVCAVLAWLIRGHIKSRYPLS